MNIPIASVRYLCQYLSSVFLLLDSTDGKEIYTIRVAL